MGLFSEFENNNSNNLADTPTFSTRNNITDNAIYIQEYVPDQ